MKNISQQPPNNRIESLDWLRGFMAFAVMCYHLSLWTSFPLDAASVLGRLGIYSVSVFFVLSGLSMVLVYHSFFYSWKQVLIFWLRRIFRIWPLLWLSSLLVVVHPDFNFETLDFGNLISTATTIFAIVHPAKYFLTGAWSIGNEMVYYLLTPLIFVVYQYKKNLGNCILAGTFVLLLVFGFVLLSPEIPLAKQWNLYVNPWNNVFFYVSGIAIFYGLKNSENSNSIALSSILFALAILFFMPNSGNQINIVTGINRIIYSIFAILVVIGFYKNTILLPRILQILFRVLGESTYGIYLLHPIVYSYVKLIAKKMDLSSSPFLVGVTFIFTIVLSYFSYSFFEKPFIKIGKRLTNFSD
jgi:exopolysaccharide production protein ExoZ